MPIFKNFSTINAWCLPVPNILNIDYKIYGFEFGHKLQTLQSCINHELFLKSEYKNTNGKSVAIKFHFNHYFNCNKVVIMRISNVLGFSPGPYKD